MSSNEKGDLIVLGIAAVVVAMLIGAIFFPDRPLLCFYLLLLLLTITCIMSFWRFDRRPIWLWVPTVLAIIWTLAPVLLRDVPVERIAESNSNLVWLQDVLVHLKYNYAQWHFGPTLLLATVSLVYIALGSPSPANDQQEMAKVNPPSTSAGTAEATDANEPQGGSETPQQDKKPWAFHEEVIAPRKSVWYVFTIVTTLTLFLASSLLVELRQTVQGRHPLLPVLTAAMRQTDNELLKVSGLLQPGTVVSGTVVHNLDTAATTLLTYTTIYSGLLTNTTRTVTDSTTLSDTLGVLHEAALLAGTLAAAEESLGETSDPAALHPFAQAAPLFGTAVSVISTDRTTLPYVSIAIAYVVFLLFPWFIYFSYIFSRRATLARNYRRDLEDFGLISKLLVATTAADATELAAIEIANAIGDPPRSITVKALEEYYYQALASERTVSFKRLASLLTQKGVNGNVTHLEAKNIRNEALEIIIKKHAFYSREYLIPMALFSAVSAIGWYYIFFTGTTAGIYRFVVENGASAAALTGYLSSNLTPVTVAFVGAWLFSIATLLNSWMRDDLIPRTYFFATARLIIGLLVGLVLSAILQIEPTSDMADWPVLTANALAFAVSIAPYDFIGVFVGGVFDTVGHWLSPKRRALESATSDDDKSNMHVWIHHSLRDLEGLSIWDETRLQQEGVDSIHALAMVEIDNLILHTPYTGLELADWIDRALLQIHVAPGNLMKLQQEHNIATATGLLTALRPKDDLICFPWELGNLELLLQLPKNFLPEWARVLDLEHAASRVSMEPNLIHILMFRHNRCRGTTESKNNHEGTVSPASLPQTTQTVLV